MRDLYLWRLLREKMLRAEALLPFLHQLAGLPLSERFPFFGYLPRLLAHEDEALRAAAVGTLHGASGILAFRQLVRALHDPQSTVRLAAVETLRESVQHDAPRWVHALFHPDVEVRKHALADLGNQTLPPWYALYLIADPACNAEARALLHDVTAPANLLPLILEYLEQGLLTPTLARQLLAGLSWPDWVRAFARWPSRTAGVVAELLEFAAKGEVDKMQGSDFADPLDRALDLFWDADEEPARAFFETLIQALPGLQPADRERLAAALLLTGARRGWSAFAAEACLVAYPEFLWTGWVARDVRHQAIRRLYALGASCPRYSADKVRRWVESVVCWRPSGGLDLWAVGGVLHLLDSKNPYKVLQEWYSLNRIVTSFLEDLEGSTPFLTLADDSDIGRAYLIDKIGEQRRPKRAFLAALLVHVLPADQLDFLASFDFQGAIQVFTELQKLAERPEMKLSENKTRQVGELLGAKSARGPLRLFLAAWLVRPAPEEFGLGLQVLGVLSRSVDAQDLLEAARSLGLPDLKKFLRAVAWCPGFPYGREVELARALAAHADQDVREWAALRTVTRDRIPPPPPAATTAVVGSLPRKVSNAIAHGSKADLNLALKECLSQPLTGLCPALARRSTPPTPNHLACVALLGSHDPVPEVDEQFTRFSSPDPVFLERLDQAAVVSWLPRSDLPLLGHAWLYRWNEHNFAFFDRLQELWPGGTVDALRHVASFTSPVLRRQVWEALALLLGIWRWREKAKLAEVADEAFCHFLVEALPTDVGDVAAHILILFFDTRTSAEVLAACKGRAALLLPDLNDEVRRTLRPWINARGLPAAPPLPEKVLAPADFLQRIRTATDLDQLEGWCGELTSVVAEEAAFRLIDMGESGTMRLAALLDREPPPPCAALLAATVVLWPEGDALAMARELARGERLLSAPRFALCLALLERGEREFLDLALAAVRAETGPSWFRPEHWQRLLHCTGGEVQYLALRLATSSQPHAYVPAVRQLVSLPRPDDETTQTLLDFLEIGTERLRELRLEAAAWLLRNGNSAGLPLLLQNECDQENPQTHALLVGEAPDVVEAAVSAALTVGPRLLRESVLLELLENSFVDEEARADAFRRLLIDGTNDAVKNRLLSQLRGNRARSAKLRRLAQSFAWGIQIGRELTGKVFAIEMMAGKGLGYTRFTQSKVYINPLPILRGEQNGRDTVEGLIVHEFGHHLYHHGTEGQEMWKKAEQEGLFRLFNLVADEHLERNLRALDVELGNRLKRLAAYAFQHSDREIAVEELLDTLQGRAFAVLSATRLGVARKAGCVLIETGSVLLEMERAGLSFARFVRALRMGLGNRHHDPLVAEALALFRGKFRTSTMQELYERARRLREIFGWQVQLLGALGQDGILSPEDTDMLGHGEGISNDEVQSEVRRILEPPRPQKSDRPARGRPIRALNVNPSEQFNPIPTVVPVPHDPVRHAVYASQVARPAQRMRQYLEELGLALTPRRFRLRGKSFDRTRIQAVVLRGDPRMLIARETQVNTDLFLGVVIDCSGSMGSGANIEKAKLFATLLAEAGRGLQGVDVRLFGFTDSVIYDAGTANRCGAHDLKAGGGNNDAAGLWHAAQAAQASRRKAKLLVMISDGLPTECSVAALRALVANLSRRLKICCAQVAVAPLAEVCFPHYVLLKEQAHDACVRQFGTIVARLVRKVLHGG